MTKFSIIVPIYNVEKYLPKCLDSLINQTYSNIEIICVNDGSTDNSLQILEEYANKDKRIKIINQENQGVSVARNNGIDNATGDYILFVDSDDWLEIYACDILNKKLEKNNSDLIIFNAYIAKNNQCNLGFRCNQENIMYSNMWSICYKREFLNINNIRFPQNIKIAEDHIFKIQSIVIADKISIVDEFLYYYLADRENSSSKIKTVIQDDIKSYKYTVQQDWFKNATKEQQEKIIDFWIKLISGTLFGISKKDICITDLENFMKDVKQYQKEKSLQLTQIKNFETFIFLIHIHLFNIYKNIIRPIGKYCIVLPYRRIKKFLRNRNG